MKTKKTLGKRIISIVLTLLIVLSLVPMSVFSTFAAETNNLSVTIDTGETVTLYDFDGDGAYDIGTADELYAFAAIVNGGNKTINAELTASIVINNNVLAEDGTLNENENYRVWAPIGSITSSYEGVFEGNGNTISGLYFNDPISNEFYGVGLFGYVSNCELKNINIVDSYFNADDNIGVIAGVTYNSNISNCYSEATIEGRGIIGGIVSYLDGTVTDCCNSGLILSGTSGYCGGIAGINGGTINNCYNTGSIIGVEDKTNVVGGICGSNDEGTVQNSYNTGSISGYRYIGGINGNNIGDVSNCYSIGEISGSYFYGGIIGINRVDNSLISNCYYLNTACDGGIDGADVKGSAEAKTLEKFKSGEVAFLLGDAFGQTINEEDTPVISGAKVYCGYETCADDDFGFYTNSSDVMTEKPEHKFVNDVCSVCSKVCKHEYVNSVCKFCKDVETKYTVEDIYVSNDAQMNYNRYYYSQLSDYEKEIYEYVEYGLRNMHETIYFRDDFEELNFNTAVKILMSVTNDYPEYFWYDNNFLLSVMGGMARSFTPSYNELVNDIDKNKEIFVSALNDLVVVNEDVNGYLALLDLHDTLVSSGITYVELTGEYDSAYHALVTKKADDIGFAKAYAALVNVHPDSNITSFCVEADDIDRKNNNNVSNSIYYRGMMTGVRYTVDGTDYYLYSAVGKDVLSVSEISHTYFNRSLEYLTQYYSVIDRLPIPEDSEGFDYWSMNIKSKFRNYGIFVLDSTESILSKNLYGRSGKNFYGVEVKIEVDSLDFVEWVKSNKEAFAQELGITGTYSYGYYLNGDSAIIYFRNCTLQDPVLPQLAPAQPNVQEVDCKSVVLNKVFMSPDRKDALYSIDGENWQDSNVFESLTNGTYKFYVKYPAVEGYYYESPVAYSDITITDAGHKFEDGFCVVCGGACEAHEWADGICTICSIACSHEWADGVCTICSIACSHEWEDSTCTICHKACEHEWNDGVCSVCNLACDHDFVDSVCTICTKACTHEWVDGTCTICLKVCEHEWYYGACDICSKACDHAKCTAEYDWYIDSYGAYVNAALTCVDCGNYVDSYSDYPEAKVVVEPKDCINPGSQSYTITFVYNGEVFTDSKIIELVSDNHVGELDNGFCSACNGFESAYYNEETGVYEISNAGQLYWYAQQLNENNVEIQAKLTNDIVIPENAPEWVPINSSYVYFDGNYKTIAGLKCVDLDAEYVGLFGNEGWWYEIENLHITDSYFEGNSYVGAVVANYTNGGSITNCYVTDTTVKSDSPYAGTLVGCLGYGSIINCYADTDKLVGYNYSGSIENSYYLADTDDGMGGKTVEQFESGEVAFLLGEGYGQRIGKEDYPVLNGSKVYKVTNCNDETIYSNINGNGQHNYVDGSCTDCGETEPVDKHEGYSISLGGNIAVNYYMTLTNKTLNDENAKMVFTVPNGDLPYTVEIPVSEAQKNGDYYIFTCEVAAKEMTSTISALFVTSETEIKLEDYSVVEYAEYIIRKGEPQSGGIAGNVGGNSSNSGDNNGSDIINPYAEGGALENEYTKAVPLVKAMLNYGAYSQQYFGYNINNLANVNLKQSDKALVTELDLSQYAHTVSGEQEGVSFYGGTLSLKSETAIKLYFEISDDVDVDALAITVNGETAQITPNGKYYELKISDIPAHKLSQMFEIKIGELTLNYGAFSYGCSAMNTSKDSLKNAVKALYAYSIAADAYIA